ncbi:MAG: hypothetical protein IPK16_16970 [Anaerolineales bacterium]|nr:hypothetical protein [Anaerolineales bacterium]
MALPGTQPGSITLNPVVRTQPSALAAAAATEAATVVAAAVPDATAIPVPASDVATTAQISPTAAPAPTATATAAPATGNNELIIFGGSGVISTVWWQNQTLGYGLAQISAPYNIVRINRGANDNGSVLTAVGLTRLSGSLQRNFMCEAELFTRMPAAPLPSTQPLFQQPITYESTPLGITFCSGPPGAPPYYPEGVVQAFVQPYNPDSGSFEPRQFNSVRQQLLAPSIAGQLGALVDLVTFTNPAGGAVPTLVDELVTPFTVTVPSTVQFTTPESAITTPDMAITTPVCVQIRPMGGADTPRRLIFVLQHVAPNQQAGQDGTVATTDQMQIIYGADVTSAAEDCQTIIGMPIRIAGPPP